MTTGSVSAATAAQRGGQGVERERPLSDLERDKYEDLLRKLTVRGVRRKAGEIGKGLEGHEGLQFGRYSSREALLLHAFMLGSVDHRLSTHSPLPSFE